MRIFAAAAFGIALAAGSPARAQEATVPDFWDSAIAQADAAADYVFWPVGAVWQAAMSAIWGAEQDFVAHITQFAATLRDDVERFETLVGRAGFRLTMINITPGVIPEIELTFEPLEDISAEDEANLRADLDRLTGVDGAIERAVVIGLLDVEESVESVRPDGFHISEVDMALVAIFPEISVAFSRGEP